ncbi:MAG: acyltransferase [Alphaproteobacteria bacterium]|nr:acyltransferase [Alphaproteobacteria bacterium]
MKILIKMIIMKLKGMNAVSRNTEKLRMQGFDIGEGSYVYSNAFLDKVDKSLIKIGAGCVLTGCTVLTHDASAKISCGETKFAPVEIEDNCFIGWQSIVLMGVKIGKGAIVGAGSVVTKDVPPNSVVAGNPAVVIKKNNK